MQAEDEIFFCFDSQLFCILAGKRLKKVGETGCGSGGRGVGGGRGLN